MTWADLLPGDVLLTDEGYPVIVVLSCVRSENKFTWTTFDDMHIVRSPDLDFHEMWEDLLAKSYPALLRGPERIVL